jgi:pilus assembly protein CpaB
MKNKLAILIAIAVGLVAVILIYAYIRNTAFGGAEDAAKVRVIVANKNLAEGRTLRAGDWAISEMPAGTYKKARHLLINSREVGIYAGQVLTRSYRRGEYLSQSTFRSQGSPEDFTIEEGSRAVTINVDDVSGVAGLIRPKDRVDVVLVERLSRAIDRRRPTGPSGGQQPASGERVRVTVFRNVLVLATGRQTTTLDIGNVRRGGYRTVTFELPDEKALVLSSVQNFATITLMLRNQNDLPGRDIRMEVDSANLLETLEKLKEGAESPPGD